MSDAVLLFLILVIVTVGGLFLVLYSRKKKAISNRTPAALANQVLRYPERILIDVPLYTSTTPELHPYEFLLKTEAELATIGELESRRQFLVRYAEVINEPSKDSIKSLTDFLLRDAPVLFRETLHWDGRCNKAFQFLEFTDDLIESIEKGKSLQGLQTHTKNKKGKKLSHKSNRNDLQGEDEIISQEWNRLNQALHRTIAALRERKGEMRLNLLSEDQVPHLTPFLKAARDVCKSAVLGMAHSK